MTSLTKSIFVAVLTLSVGLMSVQAQNKKKHKKANKLYAEYAYAGALDAYTELHEKEGGDDLKIKIAECFMKLNRPVDVAAWYGKVEEKEKMKPAHHYNYAQALISTGKNAEAKKWMELYHEEDIADSRGEKKLYGLGHMGDYYKDSAKYHLSNMEFNTQYADFAPSFFEDGIVFVSNRVGEVGVKHTFKWDNSAFLDVYYAKRKEEGKGYEEPHKFNGAINTKYHEGPLSFNGDYNKVIFTRNNYIHGHQKKSADDITKISLYFSEKTRNAKGEHGWHHVHELSFDSKEYSVGDPSVSKDFKKMIFASDMPGGHGGTDLWMSKYNEKEDTWGNPVNLGEGVNTEGNERFPYLHPDGTLYFSSDGHGGIGGLDIYEAIGEKGLYTEVIDLGYPINTPLDDFGLVYSDDKSYGYFSSNRAGGKGQDDVYKFLVDQIMLTGVTFVKQQGHELSEREILPQTKVIVYDKTHDVVYKELLSDSVGGFEIGLNKGVLYEIKGVKDSLIEHLREIDLREVDKIDSTQLTLQEKMPDKIPMEVVFLDKDTKDELAGVDVYLMNTETGEVSKVRTGEDGKMIADLSPESSYVVKGSKLKYLSECITFTTPKRSRDIHTTEEPVYMELVKLNQRMVLENVYFDLAKHNIRADAAIELDKVVSFLDEHPGVKVELGSHTDCRGSDGYNLKLSSKRAKSSVDYIVSKGISSQFITSKGYGETQLTNRCDDGVKCGEDEHQKNRRTEIKITGITELSPEQKERYEKEKSGLDKNADTSDCETVSVVKKN